MNDEGRLNDFILLNTGQASHNGDWNWRNICSPFIRIHYIRNGTAQILYKDESFTLRKGYMYLTPSYKTHSYRCDGELSLAYIHIYEETGNNLSVFDMTAFPVEVEVDSLMEQLAERLLKINPDRELHNFDPKSYDNHSLLMRNIAYQKKRPFAYEVETQGILSQLIARFLEHASYENLEIDSRILKAIYAIHQNISGTIGITELSNICALTKDHFIRLFKREMGITPTQYIIQKKIEKAQLLLLIQQMPISQLAYKLGFENIPYFNRLFKKQTGTSPASYRKKMRTENS